MQSNAKIVLEVVTDAQQAEKQAKQIGERVAKSAEKGAKKLTFGEKIKQNLEQVQIGIENLGIGGDRLAKLGDLFKGGGWIAAAAAGVTLLAQGAMKLWDKMTVSAQQAMAKAKELREISQQKVDKTFENEADASGYFQRLKQLNEQEQLSNLHKMQSIAIVNNLTKVYGDLGLTISGVTGKVLGLDDAMEKVAKRNRQIKIKESQNIVNQSKQIADQQFKKIFESFLGGLDDVTFLEKFGQFQGINDLDVKGIDMKFNESYKEKYTSVKQGTTARYNLSQQQKKDAQLWNSGLQGKAQWAEQKRKASTTDEQAQNYSQLRDAILKLIQVKKQHESIKKYGTKTTDEYLKNLQRQNQQTQKLKDSVKKQAEQYIKLRNAKQQSQFYGSLTPTSTKIAYQQVKLQQNEDELKPLKEKSIKIKAQLQFADKQLGEALKSKDVQRIEKAYKRVNELIKESAQAEKAVLDKENKIRDIKAQIAKLQRKQTDQSFKKLKNDEQRLKKLKKELQLQNKKQKQALKKKTDIEEKDTKSKKQADQYSKQIKKLQKIKGEITQVLLGVKNFKLKFEYTESIQKLKKQMDEALGKKDYQGYKKAKKDLAEIEKKLKEVKKWTEDGWWAGQDPLPNFKINPKQFKEKVKLFFDYESNINKIQDQIDNTNTIIEQKIKQFKDVEEKLENLYNKRNSLMDDKDAYAKNEEEIKKAQNLYNDLSYQLAAEQLKKQRLEEKRSQNLYGKVKIAVEFGNIDYKNFYQLQKKVKALSEENEEIKIFVQIRETEEKIDRLDDKIKFLRQRAEKGIINPQQSVRLEKYIQQLDFLQARKLNLVSDAMNVNPQWAKVIKQTYQKQDKLKQALKSTNDKEKQNEIKKQIEALFWQRMGVINQSIDKVEINTEDIYKAQGKLEELKKKMGQFDDKVLHLNVDEFDNQRWRDKIKQGLILEKKLKQLQQKRKAVTGNSEQSEKQRQALEKEALKAKMRQLQIQAQINQLNQRSADYYAKQKEQLDKQFQVEQLILQGRYDQAQKLKIINQLKQQGLKIDQKEIDAILARKKALQDLNIDKSIKQQGQSLLDRVGANNKQYQYEKRIRQLEQANGKSLTSDQKDKVKTIVDLEFKMNDMEKLKPNFADLQIKTNELTARGGFAGGAVAPDIDLVNKQIRDYQAKSVTTLTQIKQILQKGGVI